MLKLVMDFLYQAFEDEESGHQLPKSPTGDVDPSQPPISTDNGGSHSFRRMFHGSHNENLVTDGSANQSLCITYLPIDNEKFLDSLAEWQLPKNTPDNPDCERWFVDVPPVIIFSLRRLSFDKSDHQTVKAQKEFSFPDEFFIDRYLLQNRGLVNATRIRVMKLHDQLNQVLANLKQFDELSHALRTSMLFMGTTVNNSAVNDSGIGVPKDIVAQPPPVSTDVFDRTIVPSDELIIIDRWLNMALQQATDKAVELRRQETELRHAIDSAYDEDSLLQHPYRLHAALIHEDEANGSLDHYWAYIADHATVTETGTPAAWRKYSDKTVEPATWEAVTVDSYGTRRNCSAYCLIYADKNRLDLFDNDAFSTCSTVEKAVQSLPRDLAEMVGVDNQQTVTDLLILDLEERQKLIEAMRTSLKDVQKLIKSTDTTDHDVINTCIADAATMLNNFPNVTALKEGVRNLQTKIPKEADVAAQAPGSSKLDK